MPPTNYANPFTDSDSIKDLLSVVGVDERLDDDADGTVDTDEEIRIHRACNVATARVLRYTQTLYDSEDLITSWSVWQWATVIAAYWVCSRRGNPVAASLQALYDETLEDLTAVKMGLLPIEDIGYKTSLAPVWSNVRVDSHYSIRQLRVERPISERSPSQFPQKTDWLSDVLVEPTIP